ncbi:hypothetical protein [Roseobacter sp. A03A-229]
MGAFVLKSEFKEPEYWAYEKRPWHLRRPLMREASDNAEWQVPQGRIGGLVRQQRRRAQLAATRGSWLFVLLFVVISLALTNYVGTELFRQIQDGTKIGLEAEASVLDMQLRQMDRDRDVAWSAITASVALSLRPFDSSDGLDLDPNGWAIDTNDNTPHNQVEQ